MERGREHAVEKGVCSAWRKEGVCDTGREHKGEGCVRHRKEEGGGCATQEGRGRGSEGVCRAGEMCACVEKRQEKEGVCI